MSQSFTIKDKYKILCKDAFKALDMKAIKDEKFDLVVTSPPYNIGKEYEEKLSMQEYIDWQESIIDKIIPQMSATGSICWQVGNHVDKASILPLDYIFHEIFAKHGLLMRNRIIWTYGHGFHARNRFSGRYEVVMWYTKSDEYTFNLDNVRIPQKYPNKKAFSGPKKGQLSGNSLGKNPEDVWNNIPNVKSNHIEKIDHPCQFPVGLIERLVLSLTNKNDLVFDPYMGVASAGVAALIHERRFKGIEIDKDYFLLAKNRLDACLDGSIQYRPHDLEIFDPNKKDGGHRKEISKAEPELIFSKNEN
tara:strand:- start:600 stop:1514 length:915 start_codon:yes stop_codon:yes gene_type:complete